MITTSKLKAKENLLRSVIVKLLKIKDKNCKNCLVKKRPIRLKIAKLRFVCELAINTEVEKRCNI